MNHDEFIRRTLELTKIPEIGRIVVSDIGNRYLRRFEQSIAPAGHWPWPVMKMVDLEQVFRAFLTAPNRDGPLQQAFRHFLTEHIRFDSDPVQGHGAFCRHLTPDNRVLPLWAEFKDMLIEAVPRLTA
jgi:hypothetical protein